MGHAHSPHEPWSRPGLLCGVSAAASLGGCLLLVASRDWGGDPLGLPAWWTWILTGVNLAALWLMSRHRASGWVTAAALQPPTVVFCILTGQHGFVVGSTISAVLHLSGFRRAVVREA